MLCTLALTLALQAEAPTQPPTTQEPTPPTPPEAAPQEQEPDTTPPTRWNRTEAMAEINAAIEAVRDAFTDVDRVLTDARDQAEASGEEGTPIADELQAAAQHATDLIADMDHLLELLPEDDSQNSKSNSSSSSGSHSQSSPRDPKDRPEPRQEPDQAGAPQEADQSSSDNPPPDLMQSPVFLLPGASGAWGELPPRLQETLQNAHAEDLPLRYRKRLEQFHGRQQRSDS